MAEIKKTIRLSGRKRGVIKFATLIMPLLSKRGIANILALYEKFSLGSSKKAVAKLRESFACSMVGDFILRIARAINYRARKKLALTLIADGFILRESKRQEYLKQGKFVPTTVLISPTMRCNLRCRGCYAGNYSQKDDLPYEVVDRVVNEAEEIGVAFITILGGEPFIWPGLMKLFASHPNMYFQVFTNSTLINEKLAKELSRLGNVILMLSIEGFKEETDRRREVGVYDKILKAMDILRKVKVPFGYSVAVSRENEPVIASEKFVDLMIEKGALIGWLFLYMPVGKNPDLSLMPTPEQRKHLLTFDNFVRQKKSIFIVDFWNDAPFVGGCIAGKHYIHITSDGWAEPCIFSHIAQDNIKEKTILEAMNSSFFQELRRRQPYNENLYLPCAWIDNPEISRDFQKQFNLHFTHPGAEDILVRSDLIEGINKYSQEVKAAYKEQWEKDRDFFTRVGTNEKLIKTFGRKENEK